MDNREQIAVEPKSRNDLRMLAKKVREKLGISDYYYFPATQVLELLHLFDKDAYFEIVPKEEMNPETHAETDIFHKVIRIREDVYDAACEGSGRDRMTIVHEFAHFIMLCVCGFKFARTFDKKIVTYRDPEWQAKCLAGELMMDSELIRGMKASEVVDKCGVSPDAAILQLKKI